MTGKTEGRGGVSGRSGTSGHLRRDRPPRWPSNRTLPNDSRMAHYGSMDPWQASVESRLTELRDDVRDLGGKIDSNFKWVIGGFVTLAGMIVSSYLLLAEKIAAISL